MSDNFSYYATEDFPPQVNHDYHNPFDFEAPRQYDSTDIFSNERHASERHESPDNRITDDATNDSTSSLNYSPNYMENNDQQSYMDQRSEAEALRHTKVPPILKKGIQKMYEPIVDNNMVYEYEKDPEEYKKARKRVQNRESATRVRAKKKNHVEEIESEMDIMKRENANLKVENATLRAENSLLRQQTSFLEKMVMNGNNNSNNNNMRMTTNAPTHYVDRNYEECLLPLVDKADERPGGKTLGYFRAAPPHTFKKHATMLAVFTALLCCYGLIGAIGGSDQTGAAYPTSITDFSVKYGLTPQGLDNDGIGGVKSGYRDNYEKTIKALLEAQDDLNLVKTIGKWTLIFGYLGYFIYVLLIANWKYVFKMKSMKIL